MHFREDAKPMDVKNMEVRTGEIDFLLPGRLMDMDVSRPSVLSFPLFAFAGTLGCRTKQNGTEPRACIDSSYMNL